MRERFVSECLLWYNQGSGDLSRDTQESPVDNTLIVLGGEFPFIYLFGCVGGVLVGDCSRLSQVSDDWTRWTRSGTRPFVPDLGIFMLCLRITEKTIGKIFNTWFLLQASCFPITLCTTASITKRSIPKVGIFLPNRISVYLCVCVCVCVCVFMLWFYAPSNMALRTTMINTPVTCENDE